MHAGKGGVARLEKRTIEAGVVADHETHPIEDTGDAALVDAVPANHRVGDAGQANDLRRNRRFRVLQAFVPIDDPIEPSGVAPVLAGRDGEVDDPVAEFGLQAGRLGVDDREPAAGLAADVLGEDMRVRNAEPAQHPVVGVRLEHLGGVVDVHRSKHCV